MAGTEKLEENALKRYAACKNKISYFRSKAQLSDSTYRYVYPVYVIRTRVSVIGHLAQAVVKYSRFSGKFKQ